MCSYLLFFNGHPESSSVQAMLPAAGWFAINNFYDRETLISMLVSCGILFKKVE